MNAKSRKFIVRSTTNQAVETAAGLFRDIVCQAIEQRGRCHVALAGGTTPHPLYLRLGSGSYQIPWGEVEIYFGDERDVPHDSVESNYGMAQRVLLDSVPVSPSQIHPMPADSPDLQQAAQEYEQTLRRHVPCQTDGLPRFDLILLGMGADGHTASIFPDSPAMAERHKLVMSYFVPVLGRNRMTLTLPLINAARHVLFLVLGADKADAMAALLGGENRLGRELPAGRVDLTDGEETFVLDAPAAQRTDLEPA